MTLIVSSISSYRRIVLADSQVGIGVIVVNRFWRHSKHTNKQGRERERGQSLVELAFIVPILIFIFMGLIEVGWAIRGYLVLLTAGRETARFAARGDSLDFSGFVDSIDEADPEKIIENAGYYRVLNHTNNLLTINGLGLNLGLDIELGDPPTIAFEDTESGAMILTHVLVDTGLPCAPDATVCDCDRFRTDAPGYPNNRGYELDDLVLHPDRNGYDHFRYSAGLTVTSRLDMPTVLAELKSENNLLNCNILERTRALSATSSITNPAGSGFSVNSVVIVESFFDQKQVLGAPFISNALTDPVSLYNRTFMRIATSTFNQGEGCELAPLGLPDPDPNREPDRAIFEYTPTQEVTFNIGNTPADARWLRWTDVPTTTTNIEYGTRAIQNRRLAINEFNVDGDTVLNGARSGRGDTVRFWTIDGANDPVEPLEEMLTSLKGQTLTFPKIASPQVNGFAKWILIDHDLDNNRITLQYVEEDTGCPLEEIETWE